MSIVEYDLGAGEEPFLSYTLNRAEGPPLLRTGTGPPAMHVIDRSPTTMTTHPIGLRLGTWLVLDERREKELQETRDAIDALPQQSPDLDVLRRALNEVASLSAHDLMFVGRMKEYEIVGMHGCGDLTMNDWKVAYVDGPLAEGNAPSIVALANERLDLRRYPCLVKWKPRHGGMPRMSIEELQFNRPSEVEISTTNMVWLHNEEDWLARGVDFEFALSSPQVLRNGEVISAVSSCHQFGDLRHLLQLPNLNPPGELYVGEPAPPRPRRYFGKLQYADIWLGESTLIEGKHNLIRAALTVPITIPIPPECTEEQLRGALANARYEEVSSGTAPLVRGQWRFTDLVPGGNTIEVFFRRNTYSWNMIGLSKDNVRMYSLASSAVVGETGFTLEDAAHELKKAGAWNALLIDEGLDVFQRIREEGKFVEPMPLRRNRLRAVFIFACRQKELK